MTEYHLKFIDFGLSKFKQQSMSSGKTSKSFAGTLAYMAPELL
jgi:serine/threonine protein kinase